MRKLLFLIALLQTLQVFGDSNVEVDFELPKELQQDAERIHELCVKESYITENTEIYQADGTLSDDRNLSCYFHCFFREMNTIDEAGNISLKNMSKFLPPEVIVHVDEVDAKTDDCKNIYDPDVCRKAFLFMKCYFEFDEEAELFVRR